jgi:hypothetical protein
VTHAELDKIAASLRACAAMRIVHDAAQPFAAQNGECDRDPHGNFARIERRTIAGEEDS